MDDIQKIAFLAKYLKPHWSKALLLCFSILSSVVLQILNPQIIRYFIDTAVASGPIPVLVGAALQFIGIALAIQLLSIANAYLSEDLAWATTNRLRVDLTKHCLHLNISFHETHPPGEMIERIDGDVNGLASFFSEFVVNVLGSLLLLAGILITLLFQVWQASAAIAGFAVIAVITIIRIRNIAVEPFKAARQANAELFGFLEEHLAGTEDIRSSGAIAHVLTGLDRHLYQRFKKERKAESMGAVTWATTVVLFAIGTVLALSIGAYLFATGAVTLGTAYLIFYYTELVRRPIQMMMRQIESLQRASASISRVTELMQIETEDHRHMGTELHQEAFSVVFQNISFAYDPKHPILHDFSFELQPGKRLGLLGATGSGKTTVARLLLRLYEPQSGRICLNGMNIQEFSLSSLRRGVGLVTQEVQLFYATIRDNLTLFEQTISDLQIEQALRELGLWPWYQQLQCGLDTLLTSSKGLSAGEAQLLAMARIFLRNPRLVILDEASSRLDPVSEQLIDQALKRLLHNRTALIIAHHLATVQRADEIMILEQGRVLEHGGRESLQNDPNSHFSKLLKAGLKEVVA